MKFMLFVAAFLCGANAYEKDDTMSFIFAIVFTVLGVVIEIVDRILEYKREAAKEPASSTDASL